VNELFESSLQFPTVIFTIALGIALVYWLFVLVGALDLDLLGGGHVDMDMDMSVDHDVGHDVDADGVWGSLGLGTVPLTISISMILLVAWVASLMGDYYVVHDSGVGKAILIPIVLLVAVIGAAILVRPLRPVFAIKEGKTHAEYIGHLCTITTNTVDETFGFANIEDGGSLVQISVRCDQPGKLARGDKALIIELDPERRIFVVEPSADMLARTKES